MKQQPMASFFDHATLTEGHKWEGETTLTGRIREEYANNHVGADSYRSEAAHGSLAEKGRSYVRLAFSLFISASQPRSGPRLLGF